MANKSHLNVIDYIGNHRSFLVKIRAMFLPFMDSLKSDAEIALALKRLDDRDFELPAGCEVTYELEAKNIISSLLRTRDSDDAIITFYRDYLDRNGVRPTAGDVFRAGYNPRSLKNSFGTWFGFVNTSNGFSTEQQQAYDAADDFFQAIENTQMSKSYKMLLLMALVNLDAIPGESHIDALTDEFKRVAQRSEKLSNDVG